MAILILTRDSTFMKKRLIEEFAIHGCELFFSDTIKDFIVLASHYSDRKFMFKNESVNLPEAIVLRLNTEDLDYNVYSLLRQFEYLGIPVINSSESTELARDKLHTYKLLSSHSIPVPITMLFQYGRHPTVAEREIGFPCVLKTHPSNFGRGVKLCNTRKELDDIYMFVDEVTTDYNLIVQEFVSAMPGNVVRSMVVGNTVYQPMKWIGPDKDDIRTIIGPYNVGPTEPYPLTDEIINLTLRIVNIMKLDIAGIDLLFDHTGFKVSEVNACPGVETYEHVCNVNFVKPIVDLVLSKI